MPQNDRAGIARFKSPLPARHLSKTLGGGGRWVDTVSEKLLLENALNALDRLFDGHCGATDVWALFVATSQALRDTPHGPALAEPLADLEAVWRAGGLADAQRDRALWITDPVRRYLAKLLPPLG